MAVLKTQKTTASVDDFINSIPDERKRQDSIAIVALMGEVIGEEPAMWGDSIVGFGRYHYKYASGREGDWPLVGFSPRKQNLTLYLMSGFTEFDALLAKLGKFKTGKGCLYINKLADVDIPTLRELIKRAAEHTLATYPPKPS